MAGMILIKTKAEEHLMFELMKEFGAKMVLPRRYVATETFKKYANEGCYGVLGAERDIKTNETLYEIALPEPFVKYIDYEIHKLRDFLNSVKQQNESIQT